MVKKLLIIIVFSLALTILITYLTEYFQITDRLQSVKYTVETAVDTALQLSTSSDDFFDGASHYGKAFDESGSKGTGSASLMVWNKSTSSFMSLDLLKTAVYVDSHNGELPQTDSLPSMTSREAYRWCFENNTYFNSVLRPFLIDKLTRSYTIFDPTLGVISLKGALLDQMGYNVSNPSLTVDSRFSQVEKSGYGGSYMLAPSTLGVTYINTKILLPAVKANLESLMRLRLSTPTDATGCIPAFWGRSHSVGEGESIINNGVFELDLKSVHTDVSYNVVDMYDSKNDSLLNFLFGGEHAGYSSKAEQLKSKGDGSTSNNIVVAKVIVTMRLHIPYITPWMQRGSFDFAPSTQGINHFDMVDMSEGSIKTEGVPYKYQTYFAISR